MQKKKAPKYAEKNNGIQYFLLGLSGLWENLISLELKSRESNTFY